MLRFLVLGPLVVERDGETLELGSRKQKTTLAVLAAHAGSRISVDQCLQAVWGEDAPSGAVRSLHTYVSNLRNILDPERNGVIEGLDGAYRLNLFEGDSADWVDFEDADEADPHRPRVRVDRCQRRPDRRDLSSARWAPIRHRAGRGATPLHGPRRVGRQVGRPVQTPHRRQPNRGASPPDTSRHSRVELWAARLE